MIEAQIITDQYQHMGVALALGVIVLALIIGAASTIRKGYEKTPPRPARSAAVQVHTPAPKPRRVVRFVDADNDITWVNLSTGEIRVTEEDLTNDDEWAKVEAWEEK